MRVGSWSVKHLAWHLPLLCIVLQRKQSKKSIEHIFFSSMMKVRLSLRISLNLILVQIKRVFLGGVG
ncbi:hypothetical protein VK98_20830 [Chromobacterium sp. LK11]|nr:hypothetical protein VK98_20830 [Chromobacterium sp. LK11]